MRYLSFSRKKKKRSELLKRGSLELVPDRCRVLDALCVRIVRSDMIFWRFHGDGGTSLFFFLFFSFLFSHTSTAAAGTAIISRSVFAGVIDPIAGDTKGRNRNRSAPPTTRLVLFSDLFRLCVNAFQSEEKMRLDI